MRRLVPEHLHNGRHYEWVEHSAGVPRVFFAEPTSIPLPPPMHSVERGPSQVKRLARGRPPSSVSRSAPPEATPGIQQPTTLPETHDRTTQVAPTCLASSSFALPSRRQPPQLAAAATADGQRAGRHALARDVQVDVEALVVDHTGRRHGCREGGLAEREARAALLTWFTPPRTRTFQYSIIRYTFHDGCASRRRTLLRGGGEGAQKKTAGKCKRCALAH